MLPSDCRRLPRIQGEIVTVDFVRHPTSHQLVAVPRQELMRTKNGAGTVVKILDPARFQAAVSELAERLDLTGVMNCEFIQSPDGALYLMDVNPRFSAGVSFSRLAGYDFVAADCACYLDAGVTPAARLGIGDVYVKRFADFGNDGSGPSNYGIIV